MNTPSKALQEAKLFLEQRGYAVSASNGLLIVDDPVHQITGRELQLCGYKPFHIRSLSEAHSFVIERN